jgi:hypothetical protein
MISQSNIRFLLVGLAVGFLLAIFLLVPPAPDSESPPPQMTIVMNVSNMPPAQLPSATTIPAGPVTEMLPLKLQIPSISNQGNPAERALNKAANQKYHLIYRKTPPIE